MDKIVSHEELLGGTSLHHGALRKCVMSERLNIVFLGEDSFSDVVLNSLIEVGHHVKLVIAPYYDNLIYKRLENTCLRNGITFKRYKIINSLEVYASVKEVHPDLCVISHFERLIKKPLLDIPPMGFINLHPSLLPYYRGMSPQHWPIINGDKEAGITVHYVDEGVDTGNIILQRKFPLSGNEYVNDLQKRWLEEYKTIMVEAICKIVNGEPSFSQSELKGSYYDKLTEEDCQIDLEGSKNQAYNLVRGVSMPYHGAQAGNIIIWKAHLDDGKAVNDKTVGVHLKTTDGNYVAFNDGILFIDKYTQL